MFFKFLGLCAFLGAISLSTGFNVTSNLIEAPFVKIGSGYYYIENNLKKNWYAAYESCRRLKADLVTFESVEELDMVSQYILNSKTDVMYWASGTDLAEEGSHVWFSNGQPVYSDLWCPGQPDNKDGGEHCDGLWFESETIGLNDGNCGMLHCYICEATQPINCMQKHLMQ
ncbi:C-type lectin 37Da-like [Drosophila takahashii]|uniref:C-type lectin 37Da-like n=1 Tax=Drosophila takahashii TaxID=29030 RepID=UPI001CF830B8|nr:C-type lectin 37Da-like [Drosophila takahashii]